MAADQRPVERPAGSPAAIVEQQPIAAAPDPAASGRRSIAIQISQLPGKLRAGATAHTPHPRAPWSCTACRPSNMAASATAVDRRIAEHADRQHPGLAGKSGQRRGFVCRDMAGAARHEHEAGEGRWPGGAEVSAAIEAA